MFLCFIFCVFADCNSVEKGAPGNVLFAQNCISAVIKWNFYVCAKHRKNSPDWCFWGPSGHHQLNPSSCCANQANSAPHSWHINSQLVIMDWLHLSPPKALQYRFLLMLWLFFMLRLVTSFMPLESGKNNIAEVHLIFKLQNCFYLPWGRPIFLMFKK